MAAEHTGTMVRETSTGGGPQLGPLGWVRYTWRQLTSMRMALFLLMLLALAALPGSYFPQRSVDPGGVRQYLRDRGQVAEWMDRAQLFNVYSSVWFSAIYMLLFVSLIGCIIPRVLVYARNVRRPPLTRVPAHLNRLPAHLTVVTPGDVDLADVRKVLRRNRYRVVEGDRPGALVAERGYLREAGNLLFHISLVGVLIGMATSAMFSYGGQVLLPVGSHFSHSVVNYDTFTAGSRVNANNLPVFRVDMDQFDARFEEKAGGKQFAMPREFDAQVTVTDGSGAKTTHKLGVNRPVPVGDAQLFLAGNGYAPVVSVFDASGKRVFNGPVPMLAQDGFYTSSGVVKVPDITPKQLGLKSVFLPTAVGEQEELRSIFPDLRNPVLVFSLFAGDLGLDRGAPQSIFNLDTRRMEIITVESPSDPSKKVPFQARLTPGQSIQLPDGLGSVTFEAVQRFAGLSIRHDPGKLPALWSSLLAVVGISCSLLIRRRRVWVTTTSSGSGTLVSFGGLADGYDAQLKDHLHDLARACGWEPEPATTQPEPVQPEPVQSEPVQPGTTQPGTTQPGTTQPEPAQSEPVQPEPAQPGTTQPGTTQPDPTGQERS